MSEDEIQKHLQFFEEEFEEGSTDFIQKVNKYIDNSSKKGKRFKYAIEQLFVTNPSKALAILQSISSAKDIFLDSFLSNLLFSERAKEKYEVNTTIRSVLDTLFENGVIDIQKISTLIKTNPNKYPSEKLCATFELYPILKTMNPKNYAKTVERQKNFKKIENDPKITRQYAIPIITANRDSANPRVTKYGGCCPYLPKEGPQYCKECGYGLSLIFQLYIPTAPKFIQDYFPEEMRKDCLVVLFFCLDCGEIEGERIYFESELDELVYTLDNESSDERFNNPNLVIGWKEGKMMPDISNIDSCKFLFRPYLNVDEFENDNNNNYDEDEDENDKFDKKKEFKIFTKFSRLFNKRKGPNSNTYLGGWPYFTQGDPTPDDSFLLANFGESEASTYMWGDCGTAQMWVMTGEDFGTIITDWACC